MRLYCCKCEKEVEAALVKGDVIYPHRIDLKKKNFYQCPKCHSYVGCHDKTTRPLGCIPTDVIRTARRRVHDKMDLLWKSGKIQRTALYRRISKELGYTFHTGNTKSVQECMKAWDVVDKIEKELK